MVLTRFFEPDLSVGPLTEVVTTLNMPLLGAANFAKGDSFMEFGMSDFFATVQVKTREGA